MRRLHPATMLVAFLPKLVEAFRSLVPFLLLSMFRGKGDTSELIIAAIGVLGGFGAISLYLTTRFGIEGDHIVWRSGWLFKKDRRIPLQNVQNVNLRQGVLERLMKVVTLEVETAAGSTPELKLQVLDQEEAEELRTQLLAGTSESLLTDTATAAGEDQAAEAPAAEIYRVNNKDMVLGAVTENGGLQIFFGLISLLTVGGFASFLEGTPNFLAYMPANLLVVAGALLVLTIAGIGWIWGGVNYALKYGGFSVRHELGAYRVAHGVFTKIQYSIRPQRIEFATITSTLFQRKVRRCTFSVGTAGNFGEQGMVAPLGLMLTEDDAKKALASVLGKDLLEGLEWQKIPRLYLRIVFFTFLRGIFFFLLIGWLWTLMGLPARVEHYVWVVIGILCGFRFLGLLNSLLGYRFMAYALRDQALVYRSGFFSRHLTLMPLERIEVLQTSQPLWWEGRAVARLTAVGMLHRLAIPLVTDDLIRELEAKLRSESRARQSEKRAKRAQKVPFAFGDA